MCVNHSTAKQSTLLNTVVQLKPIHHVTGSLLLKDIRIAVARKLPY